MTDVFEFFKSLPKQERQAFLDSLPKEEAAEIVEILSELETREERELCQTDFMAFVHQVWPDFIHGRHHEKMARAFEDVANGKCKRLIINMPPRHTKSEFASYLLPAWFLGKYPNKKVIQTSHTAELAVGFGRKVRNLVDSDAYKRMFPTIELQSDSKAAGRWNTNFGGDYFAIGVGGAVTGKGADILIIDDPHSEQEAALAAFNPEIYDKTYEWYTSGPRQRLQPGGAIVIVMTRWSLRDLTAQVMKAAAKRGGDEWRVIEFPAILPSGKPLWRSICSSRPQIARRSLNENGGRYGRMKIRRNVNLRSRRGILRMKRKRLTTTRRVQLGVFSMTKKTTTYLTSFSCLHIKNAWSFRNSKQKRSNTTWIMNRMLSLLRKRRRAHP